jgi:hypothetical protein
MALRLRTYQPPSRFRHGELTTSISMLLLAEVPGSRGIVHHRRHRQVVVIAVAAAASGVPLLICDGDGPSNIHCSWRIRKADRLCC